MLWFLIGFVSALLFVGLVVRRKMRRWRGGQGRGFAIRRVLARVEATPQQETEILDALNVLWSVGRGLKGEMVDAPRISRRPCARATCRFG